MREFKASVLRAFVRYEEAVEGLEFIEDIEVGKSRWHVKMLTLFKALDDGKVYGVQWRRGATEDQENEYPGFGNTVNADSMVGCEEYKQVPVTKIEWVKV